MEEYRQITLDEWTQWKEDIRRKLAETAENFVYIGYRLRQIRDSGMYDGAEDIFGFAQKEYGLGKSTVSRFIAINEKYSEGGNSLVLKEEFRNFSSSKLSEMLTLPDSEVELITEKTTIREIRELKAFNSQTAQETGEQAEAAGGEERSRTPLEKCLIDFFKNRKDMLNSAMRYLEEEPPAYKEAAELVAPSQTSHQKGIVFLFLYDWNTGIKYKLMTEPEPVSMSWAALFDIIYGIFGACEKGDVWGDFYGEQEERQETEKAEAEKPGNGSDSGAESVATSQQNEEKGQAGGQGRTPENRNRQEAAGGENEESKTQREACADSGQAGEPASDPESADKEDGACGGAGEDGAEGGTDGESGRTTAPVQPESEQLEGQMNITDYPEYMPDTETGSRKQVTGAAGGEAEPEKPEKTRTEAEPEVSEGAADPGGKITDSDGMWQHIENQKQIIMGSLHTMRMQCGEGIWDGLLAEANTIVTRVKSIKNMLEVWNG